MIPGEVAFRRAVVWHCDIQGAAVAAIVREVAGDDLGRRQELQPAQGGQRFAGERLALGVREICERGGDECLMQPRRGGRPIKFIPPLATLPHASVAVRDEAALDGEAGHGFSLVGFRILPRPHLELVL